MKKSSLFLCFVMILCLFSSCDGNFGAEEGPSVLNPKAPENTDTKENLSEKNRETEQKDSDSEVGDSNSDDEMVIPLNETGVADEEIAKWTLLVYMAADNNLEGAAIADFNELENADIAYDVNVLVLFDRSENYDATNGDWSDTRLYRISKDDRLNRSQIVSEQLDCPELGLSVGVRTELDMANPFTLSGFCEFSKKNFPAENYALIIWGHGTGWRNEAEKSAVTRAVAIDDASSSYMAISQLRSAVSDGMKEKISVIGFDTCFGMTLECAYELSDCADYMLGTPALVPESGWNYAEFMNNFSESEKTPADFIDSVAAQYEKSFCDYGYASFVCVDLQKVPAFVRAFSDYTKKFASSINTKGMHDEIFGIFEKGCVSYCSTSYPTDFYVDVRDLLLKLSAYCPGDEVLSILSQSVVKDWSASGAESSFGVFFGVYRSPGVLQSSHPQNYRKGSRDTNLGRFVRDCDGYVPTEENSGSLLDKLFYTNY